MTLPTLFPPSLLHHPDTAEYLQSRNAATGLTESPSPSSPSPNDSSIQIGDHVYRWCGLPNILPSAKIYRHHGIVVDIIPLEGASGISQLCIADFNAMHGFQNGGNGMTKFWAFSQTTFDSGGGSFGGATNGDDPNLTRNDEEDEYARRHRHEGSAGILRIQYSSEVAPNEWHKVAGHDSYSPVELVLSRVKFLFQHYHKEVRYNLMESNCECVATWCKTGVWATVQVSHFLNQAKQNTTAVASAAMSLLAAAASTTSSSTLLPLVAGASVMGAGASDFLLKRSLRQWDERTLELNAAFANFLEVSEGMLLAQAVSSASEGTTSETAIVIDDDDDVLPPPPPILNEAAAAAGADEEETPSEELSSSPSRPRAKAKRRSFWRRRARQREEDNTHG